LILDKKKITRNESTPSGQKAWSAVDAAAAKAPAKILERATVQKAAAGKKNAS
jgi:hypothetical protein